MKSRMDRYNTTKNKVKKRVNKNKELYDSIYNSKEYSNIDNIEDIKQGVISIEEIKEMLKKEKIPSEKTIDIPVVEQNDTFEIYDINKMLEIAKSNEKEDNKKRSIDTSSYNYKRKNKVKEEDLSAGLFDDLKKTLEITKENTKEVIDKTFYTTSMNLSKEDFFDGEEKVNKLPLIIFIAILSILLIGLIVYFIYLFK